MHPARYEPAGIRDLATNAVREVSTRITLLADGKAHRMTTTDLGVKAHFQGVQSFADTISLFGLSGHYVGLAPIERSRWNLAMSVPAERVRRFEGNLDCLFEQMHSENRELHARMRAARRVSDWLTCPLPRFAATRTWQPNIIPIGNAAAALEPIGGEGMGLAMRSAELAADAVDTAIRHDQPVDTSSLGREYQRLWRWRRVTARATALLMSRPRCAEILVRAMQSCQSAIRPVLAPLGK
jgi:2-polyprenyl-6-methoxyphenol hydroxylase-like FAD-dependent oxidoreductase